ncbi:hypothetical protein TRIUR3_22710 [Triticum urartu]|uniref:F-box protein At3g26010-like beta-propeller domain-containing protein n=2 Tax=Triticum urartu TaxID=4572 RepID=M8A0M9_TRIUA|nr:hypothetical protein TRIUR3_22710 [Triticum urartu]
MEAPDLVPADRFSVHLHDAGYHFHLLSCRHGLVLISHSSRNQVLVWDPVNGDQHHIAAPLGFDMKSTPMDGAVLRVAGDAHHFRVVLVSYKQEDEQATVSIYLSETGGWSDLISTPVPGKAMDYEGMPAVLAGDSLCWLLPGDNISVILEVDLDSQSLAAIRVPTNMFAEGRLDGYASRGWRFGHTLSVRIHGRVMEEEYRLRWCCFMGAGTNY